LDPDSIRSVDPDPESGSGSRRGKMTHKNRTGSGSGSGPGTLLNSYYGSISDFNLHVQFRRDKSVRYVIGSHDCHLRKYKKTFYAYSLQILNIQKYKARKKEAIHIIKLFRGCIVNNYPPCGQRLNLLSGADKAAEGQDISSQMCLKHA
jgi:hypothetical protein